MRDRVGIRHAFSATRNSLRGLRDAFKTALAFRQEAFFSVIHFTMVFVIDESFELKLLLAALWVVLMMTELINSGVEAVVDLVSPEWNLLARYAKDFCSAAVFLMVLFLACVWLIILYRSIMR